MAFVGGRLASVARSKCRHFCALIEGRTNQAVATTRSALFDAERDRQVARIGRLEKIEVVHRGVPEECTLIMNKGVSTPLNCAMHIQELLVTRSALALVNGQPWDMHRPLVEDCELTFLHFKDEDPMLCNLAFWRSCSFIVGYIMERAFKEKYFVELCSFPPPSIDSGSFVYDADLKIEDWKPTQREINGLSRIGAKLTYEDRKFERLDVGTSVAMDMFADNRFKSKQIPSIAETSHNGDTVTLYRVGDHVDISRGPMIATTNLIGRFNITALYGIETNYGRLTRVQGLAIPKQLALHPFSYGVLEERSTKLNPA